MNFKCTDCDLFLLKQCDGQDKICEKFTLPYNYGDG